MTSETRDATVATFFELLAQTLVVTTLETWKATWKATRKETEFAVWDATDDPTREAVGAMRVETWSGTRDATSGATMSGIQHVTWPD